MLVGCFSRGLARRHAKKGIWSKACKTHAQYTLYGLQIARESVQHTVLQTKCALFGAAAACGLLLLLVFLHSRYHLCLLWMLVETALHRRVRGIRFTDAHETLSALEVVRGLCSSQGCTPNRTCSSSCCANINVRQNTPTAHGNHLDTHQRPSTPLGATAAAILESGNDLTQIPYGQQKFCERDPARFD